MLPTGMQGLNYNPVFLQEALKKLSVNNLSNLRPHPAYVFFYYSHPTLLQRLKGLEKIKDLSLIINQKTIPIMTAE